MSSLPPVFIEFLGKATGFHATAKGVRTELGAVEAEGSGNMAKLGAVSKAALLGIGVAAGVAAVKTIHMAADFQTAMTRVRTGAGESAKNMGLVSQGILNMAGQVGQSTGDLAKGLYMVESAGFHGAQALEVLKTSAQGAKVGAADLATVTDAVTTAMNAYQIDASETTGVMNALVATEAEGKTNLEALAASMSGIMPVAAAAKVGMNEVLGAMATMTSQGTSANVAATYLRQTIGQLSNPSAKAAAAMKSLGLKAVDVSENLGKKGLASTLTMLTDAIQTHMGPAGTVIMSTLAKASKSSTDFQGALNKLTGPQKTYIGALATMVGGTKSMMGALQLTGTHMQTFKDNVKGIADHVKKGGMQVEGWADVQKTFNQKMAEAKGSLEAVGIAIGQKLLPYATKFAGWLSVGVGWLTKHKTAVTVLAAAIGGILVIGLAAATGAVVSFTGALLADPLTWIVIGIMALVAGLALLIMKWRTVWTWIQTNTPMVARIFVAAWRGALALFHMLWDGSIKAVHAVAKWFDNNVLKWLKARSAEMVIWWHQHGKQVVAVWHATWDLIKVYVQIMWTAIKVIFSVILSTWRTTWGIIRDTAKLVWSLIVDVVTYYIHLVMNVIAVVLDVITGKWGRVWGDLKKLAGQAIGDVVTTIKHLVGNFGTLLWDAGTNMLKGLIGGIKSMTGAVTSSIKGVASGAVSAFKDVLGIKSPSKVFQTLGVFINEGLIAGLTGSQAKVKSTTQRLANMLAEAYNKVANLKGTKGVSNHWVASHEKTITHLEAYAKKEDALLNKLAAQRNGVAAKLKTAQANLKTLQKDWTNERNSIASSIMQGVSVVMQPAEGTSLSVGDIVSNMQDQVQKATQFAANLKTLEKRGLSSAMIEQIAASGVDQGGATAAALAGANDAQIKQLNGMQKTLTKSANSTGAAVADSMYSAGINSAKGLVKGLKSQEKAIDKQMLKIAESMKKAIKQALGIKSPSTVFHEFGWFVSQGLANGINASSHLASTAAGNLLANSLGRITGDRPSLSHGSIGNVVHHHVHIEVHGSVRSDRDLRDLLQQEMLRLGSRNSGTYQAYKR